MHPAVRWIFVTGAAIAAAACGHDGSPPTPAAKPSATPPAATPTPDAPAPAPAAALPPAFADSLRRGGLTFTMPDGFTAVPTIDNKQWKYDFAMRSADGSVEVRVRVDPLDEAVAAQAKCKQDPSCHGTDPNQRGASWLMVVAADIAGGGPDFPLVNPIPAEAARSDYGADAAFIAKVVPGPEMKTDHHQALVFLIHKDDKADAVFAILHDGLTQEQIPATFLILRFAP